MNAMHPVFANRGYQHGRVVLISTHTALVSMATGVFVGIAVLDEAWPARPLMSVARLLAFVLMLTGACTMNRQNIRAFADRTKQEDGKERPDELSVGTPASAGNHANGSGPASGSGCNGDRNGSASPSLRCASPVVSPGLAPQQRRV